MANIGAEYPLYVRKSAVVGVDPRGNRVEVLTTGGGKLFASVPKVDGMTEWEAGVAHAATIMERIGWTFGSATAEAARDR